jgi:hypothetical protein
MRTVTHPRNPDGVGGFNMPLLLILNPLQTGIAISNMLFKNA